MFHVKHSSRGFRWLSSKRFFNWHCQSSCGQAQKSTQGTTWVFGMSISGQRSTLAGGQTIACLSRWWHNVLTKPNTKKSCGRSSRMALLQRSVKAPGNSGMRPLIRNVGKQSPSLLTRSGPLLHCLGAPSHPRNSAIRGSIVYTIALSGSRYHASSVIQPTLSRLMLAAHTGIQWAIGCCPTGLDSCALSVARLNHLPHQLFKAHNRTASALRLRTIQMVAAANYVISFPHSPVIAHSGSWLSVAQAATSGKPVAVWLPPSAGITAPAQLPLWGNIIAWQRVPPAVLPFHFTGAAFWQPVIQSFQTSLFNG